MNLQSLERLAFAVAIVVAGCSAERTVEPVRPSAIGALSRTQAIQALPVPLANDATIEVATVAGSPILIGGKAGLYTLANQTANPIGQDAVLGMATIPGTGVIVATSAGLRLWDGMTLGPSPLETSLEGAKVQAIAERGGQVWLGTTKDLFVLDGTKLVSLPDVQNVSKLYAASGANAVIAVTASGGAIAIRDDGGAFTTRALTTEIEGASAIVPAAEDRVFAIVGGRLEERVTVSAGEVAWLPVALTMDQKDSGATGVSAITVDPVSADAWIVADRSIVRIQKDAVSTMDAPAEMGSPIAIVATFDGTLWISNGTSLFSFSASSNPDPNPNPDPGAMVTYTKTIEKFSHDNCDRCHSQSANVAFPLTSFAAWVQNIDLIIPAVQEKRMPKDGADLVGGDVSVLEAWKTQGLLQ